MSLSLKPLWRRGKHSLFHILCLRQVGLVGNCLSYSRTCLFLSIGYMLRERVWEQFSQPWGIYIYIYFNLFSVASWEEYKASLKLVRRVLSCPLLMSMSEAFPVTCTLNNIYTSSEWVRLSFVPELNLLLQRPWIWWHCSPFTKSYPSPLQYPCLENPVDRGAWQATVQRVTESQTQLNMQGRHGYMYRFF